MKNTLIGFCSFLFTLSVMSLVIFPEIVSGQTSISPRIPAYPGIATQYLNGAGQWSTPAGSGGAGNVVNTGASVVNMVPVYTSTTGLAVTPTNNITIATLTASADVALSAASGNGSLKSDNNVVINADSTSSASASFRNIKFQVRGTEFGKLSFDSGWLFNNINLTNNLLSWEGAGAATTVDLAVTSPSIVTNIVSGNVTYAHATNGTHGGLVAKIVKFMVPSGGPFTLTLPAWRTNVFSAVPGLTNGSVVWMYLKGDGPTDTAARQTNVYVSGFEITR
jgi:hypothetical protein